jgi:anti-anti-sigma regulatory factor
MNDQVMILKPEDKENTVIYQFCGEINASILNQHQIRQKTEFLLEEGKEIFVFDFLQASSIDSSTIGLVAKIAKNQKTTKIVCQKDGLVYQVFDLVKIFTVINHFDGLKSALAASN